MSRLVRRGRILFLIIATMLVLNQLCSLGLALVGDWPSLRPFRSVLMPLVILYFTISLWTGDNWDRWLLAFCCLARGAVLFVAFILLIFAMGAITPREEMEGFRQLLGGLLVVFAVPLLYAGFYLWAGLMLIVSPSLKAFFRHQTLTAESPFVAIARWIRRRAGRPDDILRFDFHERIDALNAEAGGGPPTLTERRLGQLAVQSESLVVGDPQYMPSLEIPNIAADRVSISARLWEYPSGAGTVAALRLEAGDSETGRQRRKIGEVGIDSAKLVVADKSDFDRYWTDVGPDRIGVISTARDDTLLRDLRRRFQFETVQINPVSAHVVGPVPESLEHDIVEYLKSVPEYAQFPFMHFHVQTNNSFERVNFMEETWAFLPVGNEDQPLMFACGTGRGDGTYEVWCEFADDRPVAITIEFIGDRN